MLVCVYGSGMLLLNLANRYYFKDLKSVDSYDMPVNRRTESRVIAPATKTVVSNKPKKRTVDKKVRKKEVIVEQNKPVSYASYRENNVVKF